MAPSILTSTSILLLILTVATASRKFPFKKIYAFGDSFTDTGNTNISRPNSFAASNFPYGTTFFHRPTNRFSDGRLVIDFVAESLSLPYLPPYHDKNLNSLHGVNFAFAGATATSHDFFVKNNMTLALSTESLHTQLNIFNRFLEGEGCKGTRKHKCEAIFDDALIWVGEIGANDYVYSLGSSVPVSTIRELAVESIDKFVRALIQKGAKYIVVQGLPTTGCLPLAMVLADENDRDKIGCVASVNKQSYTHNALLQTKIRVLRKTYSKAVIAYADFWNAYRTIMMNASRYGLKERFKACCGSGGTYNFELFSACGSPSSRTCLNPLQYVNWDGVHLTEAMHKAVSDLVLHDRFCDPAFKYLANRK